MKKLFLLVCALWLGATWAAGQEYPEWVSEVQQTARQAHQGQLPTDLYRARAARESLYIGLCYDFFMQETSPFVQYVKTAMPDRADNYLQWAYTLAKGRREWLQSDAADGPLFAHYAVMAARPLDLVDMSEEGFLKLRELLRGEFPTARIFRAPRTERQGSTVMVWFTNWTNRNKVLRLAFNTDLYVLDVCRNDCEENPFR